jgi:hypothetical protein
VSVESCAQPRSHTTAIIASPTGRVPRSTFVRTTVLCGKVSISTPLRAVLLSSKHTGFAERCRTRCDNQPLFIPAPILPNSAISQSLARSDRRTKPESEQKQVHSTCSPRLAEPGHVGVRGGAQPSLP